MKYALVLVPKEADKELIVSTKYIKNFVNYNRWTKNNVFHYQRGERKFKCVILHIAGKVIEIKFFK